MTEQKGRAKNMAAMQGAMRKQCHVSDNPIHSFTVYFVLFVVNFVFVAMILVFCNEFNCLKTLFYAYSTLN